MNYHYRTHRNKLRAYTEKIRRCTDIHREIYFASLRLCEKYKLILWGK